MTYNGTVTNRDPGLVDTLDDLPAGFIGYVRVDDSGPDSPRDWGGNVATIVQENDRRGDVDTGDELRDARNYFRGRDNGEALMTRYLAAFRPDIVHYVDYWSAGRDLFGWGYITRDAWDKSGLGAWDNDPADVFSQEVQTYRQWADGEVYGVTVVRESDGEEASLWGVYDSPDGYVRSVALELVEELNNETEGNES